MINTIASSKTALMVLGLLVSVLTTTANAELWVTINVETDTPSWGEVSLDPASTGDSYEVGEWVTLIATPNEGFEFVRWESDNFLSYDAETAIIVDNVATYTAVFAQSGAVVTVIADPSGAGSVSFDPPMPDEGFEPGTEVTITPIPATGYIFGGWEVGTPESGLVEDNPLILDVDDDMDLFVYFTTGSSVSEEGSGANACGAAGMICLGGLFMTLTGWKLRRR